MITQNLIFVASANVLKDQDTDLMARATGATGDSLVTADVSAVQVALYNKESATPSVSLFTANPTPANSMQDVPVNDARWGFDTTGYNFRYLMPGTQLSLAAAYVAVCKLTLTAGGVVYLPFNINTKDPVPR